jgi:hypothetical protein
MRTKSEEPERRGWGSAMVYNSGSRRQPPTAEIGDANFQLRLRF